MSGFIAWLESLNGKDTRVRAVLRRSLGFRPGVYTLAFPYVEPFIREDTTVRQREMYYLVAGLWAAHWRNDHIRIGASLGKACATYHRNSGSNSTETRFIALLDAGYDELPHRLRQMIALLKEHSLDFEALLKGLLYWHDERKRTQTAWARDFYRYAETGNKDQTSTQKETAQ